MRLILAVGTCLVLGGCGIYSTSSGRVEESIQRVAVLYLENRTAQPNIGVELTDLIIAALQEDNTLKVVAEEGADSLIEGAVTRYHLRQVSTTGELTVDEYQVQIAVELSFLVRSTGDAIFQKKRFQGVGNYFLDDDATSEETARAEAASQIVRDVLANVVEDW